MESGIHKFSDLFSQLGLPDDSASIDAFIAAHRSLAPDVALADATFWNASQRDFIRQEIIEDADWAELVDQLDVSLR
ncbi:MAG: DUF2789 domain-containing protein [Moraxellaceae bacterium]